MKVPTIHLNGTSRGELERQLADVGVAARNFIEALGEAAPNGRDYYPQGNDAIKEAIKEHCNRVDLVKKVLDEITEIYSAVVDN